MPLYAVVIKTAGNQIYKLKLNQKFFGVFKDHKEGFRSVWADSTVQKNSKTRKYLEILYCATICAVVVQTAGNQNLQV